MNNQTQPKDAEPREIFLHQDKSGKLTRLAYHNKETADGDTGESPHMASVVRFVEVVEKS